MEQRVQRTERMPDRPAALAFAAVDTTCVAAARISPVFLVDALAQLAFAAGWRARRRGNHGSSDAPTV